MNNPKRLLIYIISTLIVCLLAFVLYVQIPRKITLYYDNVPGTNVQVYKVSSIHDLESIDSLKLVKKVRDNIQNGKEFYLQKGSYVINAKGDNIIEKRYALSVEKNNTTKHLDIPLSESYQKKLTQQESGAIGIALVAQYPQLKSLYTAKPGKFYKNGSWYAARLRYIGTDDASRDTLKVIMEKYDGKWHVSTRPPQIYISYQSHPEIPRSVIDGINQDEVINITPLGD